MKTFITLSEPASGAGCMVLAFANAHTQADYSSHRYLWGSETDIDPLGMACILLCGVAGEVVIGNALCDERYRVLLTSGHYLDGWSVRLHSPLNKIALSHYSTSVRERFCGS